MPDLNQTELSHLMAKRAGLTQKQARDAVNHLLDIMTETLARGHQIRMDNFVTLYPNELSPQTRRNPSTGEPVQVPAQSRVRVRVSERLAEIVKARDPGLSRRKGYSRKEVNSSE